MDAPEGFDTERFNALMKLADFRFQRWRERRETDWKFTLALWTLLVGAASYLIAHRVQFRWGVTAFALFVLVVVYAWFWVRNNWISNEMDIRTAFHFAEHAEKIVLPSNPGPLEQRLDPKQFRKCHRGLEFLKSGFPQVQVVGTFFFACIVFLVLVFG